MALINVNFLKINVKVNQHDYKLILLCYLRKKSGSIPRLQPYAAIGNSYEYIELSSCVLYTAARTLVLLNNV